MVDHYTYRVSWSPDDEEFVGLCAEFSSLSHLAESRSEALAGIEALVRDVVEDMRVSGEPIPAPLSEQAYSGRFQTRIPPELHRRLVIEAAEAKVSLNRLVSLKLATTHVEFCERESVGLAEQKPSSVAAPRR